MLTPKQFVHEHDDKALILCGHDNAILGVGLRCGQPSLAVYSAPTIRSNLMAEGMDEVDAIEFCEYNILGGWLGPHTPILMEPIESPNDTINRLKKENFKLLLRIRDLENNEH